MSWYCFTYVCLKIIDFIHNVVQKTSDNVFQVSHFYWLQDCEWWFSVKGHCQKCVAKRWPLRIFWNPGLLLFPALDLTLCIELWEVSPEHLLCSIGFRVRFREMVVLISSHLILSRLISSRLVSISLLLHVSYNNWMMLIIQELCTTAERSDSLLYC